MGASGANPSRTLGRGLPTSSPSANPVGCWKVAVAEEGLSFPVQAFRRRQADPISPRPSRTAVAGHGPGRAVVGRALVGRLRHRGNAARAGPRRHRGAQHREPDRVRHRDASWRSSSSRIARRSTPIRAAAAPTSSRKTISARHRRSSPPASLLIDYILTVAVSIAAGVAAITSAFPEWHVNRVELTLAFVVAADVGNLRGIRESGRIFAVADVLFRGHDPDVDRGRAWRCVDWRGVTRGIPADAGRHPAISR